MTSRFFVSPLPLSLSTSFILPPLSSTLALALAIPLTLTLYAAFLLAKTLYTYWHHTRSPLRTLPGPQHDPIRSMSDVVFGHTRDMVKGEDMDVLEAWAAAYGETFGIRGAFGKRTLVTADLRAVAHVLFSSNVYQRPHTERRGLRSFLGEGILLAEGDEHKHQRRIMNPAFGHAQVRAMMPTFLDVAEKMCDIWSAKCAESDAEDGTVRLDAMEWLSKAALDIIGRAGFDYEIGSLDERAGEKKNELAEAFGQLLRTDTSSRDFARNMLNNHFPFLRTYFPDERTRRVKKSLDKMHEIGARIVREKKAALLASNNDEKGESNDLISVLLRAKALSDDEVRAQIPTFLFAGHETTSNTATWALYALAKQPAVQQKLRAELLEHIGTEAPTLDALNALPYLDAVVRETLRLHLFVPFVTREAMRDDVIPLERPVVGRDGRAVTQIQIRKGDEVLVPVWLVNRSERIWGADAREFRPERWTSLPDAAARIPGIAPGLLTFLGGPRACIGHRFAVAEMKALLFHVVRRFDVRLAVDPAEIWSRAAPLLHPQLRSDNSVQMPVLLTPVH